MATATGRTERKATAESQRSPSWEETHQRVTFHCSVALREAIEAEMERSGRSKSRVIVDAVQAALGVDV